LDIQVRLAQAREELVRARNAQVFAERALRNLIGIEDSELVVADSAPLALVPDQTDFAARAELQATAHRQRVAEEQLRGAKAGYLPRVSAFGNVDYDYGWKFNHDGESYTAGALLQWDLWD